MPAVVTVTINFTYQLHGNKHSINAKDKAHYCPPLFAGGIWGGVPREVTYWVCGLVRKTVESSNHWGPGGVKANLPSVHPRDETLCFSCNWTAELRLLQLRFQRLYHAPKSSAMACHTTSFRGFKAFRVGLLCQALQFLNGPLWYFLAFVITESVPTVNLFSSICLPSQLPIWDD